MPCAEKSYSIAEVKGKLIGVRSPCVSQGLIAILPPSLKVGLADTIANQPGLLRAAQDQPRSHCCLFLIGAPRRRNRST